MEGVEGRGLPRLRPVDVFPVQLDGRTLLALRDRLEPSAPPVLLSPEGMLLASLLDGQRTPAGVRAAFGLRTGIWLTESQILELVRQLDSAYLLESEAFLARLNALRQQFLQAPARPAIHAGGAYPAQPEELRSFLDSFFTAPEGPGSIPNHGRGPEVVGVIAPHVDLHRGGPTYAWAYKALAESPPADLYVVLGTCHTPMGTAFAATYKPFETPFGPVPSAADFLDRLHTLYGMDLFVDEFSHRAEHSIEFQAVYLRYLGLAGGDAPGRIVPILCASLPGMVPPGSSPMDVSAVGDFIRALRGAMAEYPGRVCLIAGADLAHVGPQFGDSSPVSSAFLERVAEGDQEMLEFVIRGDADGFYRQVMRDDDSRRICGLSPIYVMLAVLHKAQGRLLKYTQWVDPAGYGSVTFASVVFCSS